MYADFPLAPDDAFIDFYVEVRAEPRWWPGRRWRARFHFDGQPAFVSLPAQHAFTMIEWGLNWCVAAHAHQFLICHAAVVERDGQALLLPAPPGSGKSTLCAALIHLGWRLLTDELALIELDTGAVRGMARPVNLKNESIPLISRFASQSTMTVPVPDTAKGTVSLLKPPAASVRQVRRAAKPAWIVVPQFQAGAPARFERLDRSEATILLAEQSFNYHIHGAQGFETLTSMVERCGCYRFSYGALDQVAQAFDALAAGRAT